MSWNVRGLNGPIKRTKVFQLLKLHRADIVFLQETHLKISDHKRLRRPWVGQVFHSLFDSKARWAAILISQKNQFISESIVPDRNGRFVIVSGRLFHLPVTLVCVYASRLLALQLKHQAASRHIVQINVQSVGLTTCPVKINSAFKEYYSKLYTSEPPPIDLNMTKYLDNIDLPTIDISTQLLLNKPIIV